MAMRTRPDAGGSPPVGMQPAELPPFELAPIPIADDDLDNSERVPSACDQRRIVFGATSLSCRDALALRPGSAIVLDETVDEPIRLYRGERLVALAKLVRVDGKPCLQILRRIAAES